MVVQSLDVSSATRKVRNQIKGDRSHGTRNKSVVRVESATNTKELNLIQHITQQPMVASSSRVARCIHRPCFALRLQRLAPLSDVCPWRRWRLRSIAVAAIAQIRGESRD